MRLVCWATFCLAGLCVALAGCESEVSRGDLGEVIFRLPDVPGADKPYPMPQLGANSKSSNDDPEDTPFPQRQLP